MLQNIAKDAIMNTSKADYAISLICSMTDEEIRKGLEIFETAYAEYTSRKRFTPKHRSLSQAVS